MDFTKVFFGLLIMITGAMGMISCTDSTTGVENRDEFSHRQNPGVSANHFLADSNYSHLILEVDYMPEYAPNARALDSLKAFFEQRLRKTSITIKEPTEIPSGNQNRYSANDIRNIEEAERSTYSKGDTLASYMVIVDGKYSEQDLLGIAYYNTSNGFFGPSYEDASSGVGAPSRYQIEAISFRHEFGHLWGLVNIPNSGTEMQTFHQDTEHGNHCDNDQCLMYYASERTQLIANELSGNGITPLDANCKADLAANGGK